jgi:hypothetical protein
MAILPISSVRFQNSRNNSVNFKSRLDSENENNSGNGYRQPRRSHKMATVPVALLIAMMPTVTEGKAPAGPEPIDAEYTELCKAVNTYSLKNKKYNTQKEFRQMVGLQHYCL